MVALVRGMHKAGKVVAAICHGGWLLCSAGIVDGRKATCFMAIKDDMIHADAGIGINVGSEIEFMMEQGGVEMRRSFILVLCLIVLGGVAFFGQSGQALAKQRKGHLLYMTLSAGYKHASIPTSEKVVKEMGERSGLFDTTVTQDVGAFTAENLKKYDVVMFYTTGELPMTQAEKDAFVHFVRSGHGFVGVHSATDTFYEWEPYLEMIGGYFNDHPWHQKVTIDVADPSSPIVSFLGKSFQVNDEIYQIADFQYKTSHVLLKLDPKSVSTKKTLRGENVHYRFYGWPLAWTRRDGKGRVFYCALGHEDAVWNSKWYKQLLLNGIKYAMGRLK